MGNKLGHRFRQDLVAPSIERAIVCALAAALTCACATPAPRLPVTLQIVGEAETFAPGIASTEHSEVRLTISPDGLTALWFSRNRPGGPGGYDIWVSRRTSSGWGAATPVSFNSPTRDFDPAFSSDGRFVYFCSDRAGSIGGDDIYRVSVTREGFGDIEHLGPEVNTTSNEFAPMLSPDGTRLLFASNRPGGAGRYDLYIARRNGDALEPALAVPGALNTPSDEFDATFLSDNASLIFSRAPDLQVDRIDLVFATPVDGAYDFGTALPLSVNSSERDTYGPMLDWSTPGQLTFNGQRSGAQSMDLYLVRYRLEAPTTDAR